jgi:hypothetical protein
MIKKVQDREGVDVQAGDVVRTSIDQISECTKIGKFNPGTPAEDKERFDVIQYLKDKAHSHDKRVKLYDSVIQRHSSSRNKTSKNELDRYEKERDWDADIRDQILTAVQILEDVL